MELGFKDQGEPFFKHMEYETSLSTEDPQYIIAECDVNTPKHRMFTYYLPSTGYTRQAGHLNLNFTKKNPIKCTYITIVFGTAGIVRYIIRYFHIEQRSKLPKIYY